jgi:ribosomal silencing factor RsfS
VEGRERYQWVLIDFVDVVVHVFQPETREYYGLERLGRCCHQDVRDELPRALQGCNQIQHKHELFC